MTPPNDKETLRQFLPLSGFRTRANSILRNASDRREAIDAVAKLLSEIDQLTAQLADRDALIVRQGEMLERARDEVCNIEFELDCALNLPGSSPSNLAKAARLSLQTATDLITALQPTAAKDAVNRDRLDQPAQGDDHG